MRLDFLTNLSPPTLRDGTEFVDCCSGGLILTDLGSFNPFPESSTLANSEDPDEMPHNAAFHQCLRSLIILNRSSKTEIENFFHKL